MTEKEEILAVQRLGEAIGYGHLMELASALWRKKLGGDGLGAFIPTIPMFLREEEVEPALQTAKMYDNIVNNALK